jgi:hypothetical protein
MVAADPWERIEDIACIEFLFKEIIWLGIQPNQQQGFLKFPFACKMRKRS